MAVPNLIVHNDPITYIMSSCGNHDVWIFPIIADRLPGPNRSYLAVPLPGINRDLFLSAQRALVPMSFDEAQN